MNRQLDTSNEEKVIYELIQNKYDGLISRYILEGLLLYTYNYSSFKTYQVLMNLSLDGRISLINLSDGEYYTTKENNLN